MKPEHTTVQLPAVARLVIVFAVSVVCSFVWGEGAAAGKEIHVFIEKQVLVALENGEEVYSFDMASLLRRQTRCWSSRARSVCT